MLKFYVRKGIIVDKVHGITSYKQNKGFEKHISFNTQKKQASSDFEEDFYVLLNYVF